METEVFFTLSALVAMAMLHRAGFVAADAESNLDFCVTDFDPAYSERPTGAACKKVEDVVSADFKFTIKPATPTGRNKLGITAAFADQWPGLNSLGSSLGRVDLLEGGLVPPHSHPRATELVYILKGSVLCGFVGSDNRLYQEVVRAGQAFVVPKALIHFFKNNGNSAASFIAFFNSQNPGLQLTSAALLASSPKLASSIVAQDWNVKSSQVDAVAKSYGAS